MRNFAIAAALALTTTPAMASTINLEPHRTKMEWLGVILPADLSVLSQEDTVNAIIMALSTYESNPYYACGASFATWQIPEDFRLTMVETGAYAELIKLVESHPDVFDEAYHLTFGDAECEVVEGENGALKVRYSN